MDDCPDCITVELMAYDIPVAVATRFAPCPLHATHARASALRDELGRVLVKEFEAEVERLLSPS